MAGGPEDLTQLIKKYNKEMKKPWGEMWKLMSSKKFWLKFIWVKDGRTSLQSHQNRTEYHFGFYKIKPNEKHRLTKGFYVELAVGKPEEGDRIIHEDDYGRK